MKSIHTLIPDIQALVTKKDGWFNETISSELGHSISLRLGEHFNSRRYEAGKSTLRLSQMGARCPRALWYSIHHPELAETLPPWAEVKFAYGHVLEALAICLAKAAGHTVTGEQDELKLDGITGHRDCIIDGCTVDVKSSSSMGFIKFKSPNFEQTDSFGYLDQLDGYVVAAREDPLVLVKDKGYILAIDKTLGHMVLYDHTIREDSIRERIAYYKQVVDLPEPPPCSCGTVKDGEGGNIKLDVRASYSPQKYTCFPGLRTFLYAGGPRYLVKVVKKPKNQDGFIPEVDKHGKYVYH